MGPQLYRCGNGISDAADYASLVKLQWGRNFIVAEICQSPIRYMGGKTLQWGRNFIVAEICMMPGKYTCGYRRASMGPQLYRCGNCLISCLSINKSQPASMGPQLYRCGNQEPIPSSASSTSCFNGAATLSLRKQLHGQRENLGHEHASMGPQLYRCGNGVIVVGALAGDVASMGPQLYRCGNFFSWRIRDNKEIASMGPQLYRCGNGTLGPIIGSDHD